MDEFGLIRKYFGPLASDYSGSLSLADDAALLDVPPGKELVVTKDAVSEGIHFLGSEDASLIAKKLLRVNLSDLAAMGAEPLCYFLAAMLPKGTEEYWVAQFARGLQEDQNRYGIALSGGDTVSTLGTLSFSITAMGLVEKGRALRRSGARPGDRIYVSGTIGDSAFGLRSLQHGLSLAPEAKHYLEKCYLLPEPHIALGQRLRGIASACMDISDGLAQDMGHIATASKVGAVIHRDVIPCSKEVKALLAKNENLWSHVISGGDDYQLLFTVRPGKETVLKSISNELQLPLTCIGEIREGAGVAVLDAKENPLAIASGFKHF